MLRLVMFVVDLFLLLPWWGAVAVLLAIVAGLFVLGQLIFYTLKRNVIEAIKAQGQPLAGAQAVVHFVKPAEPPATSSPLDEFDPEFDDEEADAELQAEFAAEDSAWYWIDATITPVSAEAAWNPSSITLIPADFQAQEELECCGQMALLHTLEIQRNGEFVPQESGEVVGSQRLRLLLAVSPEIRQAKFTYHFTEFGNLTLPARVEAVAAR